MGLAVLCSRALSGMEAALVTVEVHLANGLPQFALAASGQIPADKLNEY